MEACALLERADRMHRQFFEPNLSDTRAASWEPPVDIVETEQEIWIFAAVPGIVPQDLTVYVEANILIIAGRRRLPLVMRDAVVHRLEIPHGLFERRLQLASTQLQLGQRKLVDGCLVLSLMKPP
jgi:HSP20 family molecular chaperone IbpA